LRMRSRLFYLVAAISLAGWSGVALARFERASSILHGFSASGAGVVSVGAIDTAERDISYSA